MNGATVNTTSNVSAAEKIRISQIIAKTAMDIARKMKINETLSSVQIGGLPAPVNIVAVSASAARDAFDFYESCDGDPNIYISWFIKSVQTIMSAEYLKKKKACVTDQYWNFFHLLYDALRDGLSPEQIADEYGIECNQKMIKKAAKISECL